MTEYNIVPVADVPDQAAEVGMDPDHFEIRVPAAEEHGQGPRRLPAVAEVQKKL